MKKKLIAGNWKMNGGLAANQALLQALLQDVAMPACDVAVAVPAAYLAQGQALLQGSPISLAAQDVSQHEVGAYTGEVSAAMLGDFGVRYPSWGIPSAASTTVKPTVWWLPRLTALWRRASRPSCVWVKRWPSVKRARRKWW